MVILKENILTQRAITTFKQIKRIKLLAFFFVLFFGAPVNCMNHSNDSSTLHTQNKSAEEQLLELGFFIPPSLNASRTLASLKIGELPIEIASNFLEQINQLEESFEKSNCKKLRKFITSVQKFVEFDEIFSPIISPIFDYKAYNVQGFPINPGQDLFDTADKIITILNELIKGGSASCSFSNFVTLSLKTLKLHGQATINFLNNPETPCLKQDLDDTVKLMEQIMTIALLRCRIYFKANLNNFCMQNNVEKVLKNLVVQLTVAFFDFCKRHQEINDALCSTFKTRLNSLINQLSFSGSFEQFDFAPNLFLQTIKQFIQEIIKESCPKEDQALSNFLKDNERDTREILKQMGFEIPLGMNAEAVLEGIENGWLEADDIVTQQL